MTPSAARGWKQLCFFFFCSCILMGSAYVDASQGCGSACKTEKDCQGQLICTDGSCSDDPDVATGTSLVCGSNKAGAAGDVRNQGCGKACQKDGDCSGKLVCGGDGTCADDPSVGSILCDSASGHGSNNTSGHSGNSNGNQGGSGKGSSCSPQAILKGTGHSCDQSNNAVCCESGTQYPQFDCSPQVSGSTPATLTLNSFQQGGDGGGASACDGHFHHDSENVVALSTGWFSKGNRCNKQITIVGNGQSVKATVVDECDSQHGCDAEHAFQPPCSFDIVDASPAVWQQLGVSSEDPRFGFMKITWRDA